MDSVVKINVIDDCGNVVIILLCGHCFFVVFIDTTVQQWWRDCLDYVMEYDCMTSTVFVDWHPASRVLT